MFHSELSFKKQLKFFFDCFLHVADHMLMISLLRQPKRALQLLHRATTPPPKPKQQDQDQESTVQYRVYKSLKIWTLYVDLEESIGSFQVRCPWNATVFMIA